MILKDKKYIITGGLGLLGIEFTRRIISEGGFVIIFDNRDATYLDLSEFFSKDVLDNKINLVNLDITNEQEVARQIKITFNQYNVIDGLINNAYPRNEEYGVHFDKVNYESFVENIGMNIGSYFICSKIISQYFFKQGYGNIVNLSSIYGHSAPKFQIYSDTEMTMPVEYAVIKAGINNLTKYMAKIFKGRNIRVNAISPGGIYDEQPLKFVKNYKNYCLNKGMLQAEDISGTLVYLLSDESKFVNGQNVIVDDGFTL